MAGWHACNAPLKFSRTEVHVRLPDWHAVTCCAVPQGELEWLQLLLNTLQEGRYLTVGRSERSQGLQLLADMAMQSNSRCGCSCALCVRAWNFGGM
jgi:hypothetical protein